MWEMPRPLQPRVSQTWQVPGTNYLVYAVAPATGATQFFWGIVTLGAGTVTYDVQDQGYTLMSSHIGANSPSISLTTDGNNYIWISVYSRNAASNHYYMDEYECPYAVSAVVLATTDCTDRFQLGYDLFHANPSCEQQRPRCTDPASARLGVELLCRARLH